MFERYTENARRAIFFARYEASQFGSPLIEAEHVLLGLLREDPVTLNNLVPELTQGAVRKKIEDRGAIPPKTSTSVDLPLSDEAKRVLIFAADEADGLGDKHIGTEHLLLGLLRTEKSFSAQLLQQYNSKLPEMRTQIAKKPDRHLGSVNQFALLRKTMRARAAEMVEIHGSKWKLDYVQSVVWRLREYPWHWQKRSWGPRDIVIAKKGRTFSFDLLLAADPENFELVKNGWKKDHCAICRWELFESAEDVAHGVGYTNGFEWLCTECHGKFLEGPDLLASAYAEIT